MSKPSKCITVKEAQDLHAHWLNTRGSNLLSSVIGQDSHDFFYTLEELQEFLDYVKDESAKQGISKPGIRIYLGAYNEIGNDRTTVFLTATDGESSSSSNNTSIEPLNRGTNGWPPNAY